MPKNLQGQEPKDQDPAATDVDTDNTPPSGTDGDDPDAGVDTGKNADGTDKVVADADKDGKPDADASKKPESDALVTAANREAAKYRVELREAQAEVARLKALETTNVELTDKLTVAELAVERADIASDHGLPKDLRAMVTGNTREELEASAKLLAKYLPAQRTHRGEPRGGGLDPYDGKSEPDGKAAYALVKSRR